MGFTRLSSELTAKSWVTLDNIFILELMPFAPENYCKVYIYGKLLAENGDADNSAERMANLLGMTEDEVMTAFRYWEEQGLVRISAVPPYEVEYVPVRYVRPSQKTFSKKKYSAFNEMLYKMLPERNFLPSELNEYYSIIEDYHLDTDAMLAIIAYCVRLKGKTIGWKYITTVAQNFISDGCRTALDVETKINASDLISEDVTKLFKILKIRRAQDYDDVRLYRKWTEEMGFAPGTVLTVAKNVFGEMKGLDTVLTRYHADGLVSLKDIEEYNRVRNNLLSLTKDILIKLDERFNRLDYYAELYVKEWLKMGFDGDALRIVADYCFRNNKKSCVKMAALLENCAAEGVTDTEAIRAKFSAEGKFDGEIRKLLKLAGISDDVNSRDRDSYNIWVNYWHVPQDVLENAAKQSLGEANPRVKMHFIVKAYHESNAETLTSEEAAKLNEKLLKDEYTVRKAQAEAKYRNALLRHPELYEAEKALRAGIIDSADVEHLTKKRNEIIRNLGYDLEEFFPQPSYEAASPVSPEKETVSPEKETVRKKGSLKKAPV